MTIDERIKFAITKLVGLFDGTPNQISIVSTETLPEQCIDRDVMVTNGCTLGSIIFNNFVVFIVVTEQDNYTIKANVEKDSLVYVTIRTELIKAVTDAEAYKPEISNLTNEVIDEMMGYYNPQANASKLEKKISKIYEQDEYDEQNEKIHNIIDSSYSVSEALERIMKRD